MKKYIDSYSNINNGKSDDFENYAKEMIAECESRNIEINKDPKQLKNLVSTDLRDNIPPQIYFVVSGLIDVIKSLEED